MLCLGLRNKIGGIYRNIATNNLQQNRATRNHQPEPASAANVLLGRHRSPAASVVTTQRNAIIGYQFLGMINLMAPSTLLLLVIVRRRNNNNNTVIVGSQVQF